MLYEVALRGTYFGQETINRWNYVTTDPTTDHLGAFKLLGAMGFFQEGDPLAYPTDKLFGKLFACCNSNLAFTDVYAKAIYDPLDFYEQPFNPTVAGGRAASGGDSPTLAFGFVTTRVRTDISRGTKRLPGVSAGDIELGGSIVSGQMDRLRALAIEMQTNIDDVTDSVTTTFKPTIVSKEKYDTSPGRHAYRYYSTLTLQSAHWAQNFQWSPYDKVRTQTSRQYGRGI